MKAIPSFCERYQVTPVHKNIDIKIFEILTSLGIKISSKGFGYLQTAIKTAIVDPESTEAITKDLYEIVSKEHNTNVDAVDRNIRTCLSKMPETSIRIRIFGNERSLTNKEFIVHMARYIVAYS